MDTDIPFFTVRAVQTFARTLLPELVPDTYDHGVADNKDDIEFQFSIAEYMEGEELHNVWEDLTKEEQHCIIGELVEAIKKLHSDTLSQMGRKNAALAVGYSLWMIPDDMEIEKPGFVFGGPRDGIQFRREVFLTRAPKRRKIGGPFCKIEFWEGRDGAHVTSSYDDLGSLTVSDAEMDKWQHEAVLCHNNLTPRNLLVAQRPDADGKLKYHLAGILDWELAGFYPPSHELCRQDTYLGARNRLVSFYLQLREQMKALVPRTSSQIKLLQAFELVYQSQQRFLAEEQDVPAILRKRFLERFQLTRDVDPYAGWTRSHVRARVATDKLEEEVVDEVNAWKKGRPEAKEMAMEEIEEGTEEKIKSGMKDDVKQTKGETNEKTRERLGGRMKRGKKDETKAEIKQEPRAGSGQQINAEVKEESKDTKEKAIQKTRKRAKKKAKAKSTEKPQEDAHATCLLCDLGIPYQ